MIRQITQKNDEYFDRLTDCQLVKEYPLWGWLCRHMKLKHVEAESDLSTLMMEAARHIRDGSVFDTVASRNTRTFLLFNDVVRRTGIVLESEEKIRGSADEGCDLADLHL
jgi:hypothetical protein